MQSYLRNRGDKMLEQRTTIAEPMGLESNNNQQIIEEQLHYGNDEDFSSSIIPSQMKLSKSSLRSRWLVLALNCTVMTASYYSFDIPSALHQQLQNFMPRSDSFERNFNLLYTVYSIPNVILPLFGGNVVDRHGAPQSLFVFALVVCCGTILTSIGVSNKNWEVMFLGRFVFGLGAESLCVAQSTITSDWFEGKDVAFAMGVGLAISRLGSIFNNLTSPKVANSEAGIVGAFWVGSVLTFSSLFAAALLIFVDVKAIKKLKQSSGDAEASAELTEALLEGDAQHLGLGSDSNNKPHAIHITDFRKFGVLFWLLTASCFVVYGCVIPFNNVASGVLLERNFFLEGPTHACHLEHPNECTSGQLMNASNPALADNSGSLCSIAPSQAPLLPSSVNYKFHNQSYDYSNLTASDVDCSDAFWKECTSDYCAKQNAATEHAGKVMSIPYLISAISSPPLGFLVDKIGRRAKIAALASFLLFIVHFTLAVSPASPILPLVGQGIAYSFYAAVIWPSVPLTVEKRYTGTAFGVITSVQNIGLSIFPLIIAAIYSASDNRYIPNVELFFTACAGVGVLLGLILNRLDRRHGGKLNGTTIDEREVDENRDEGDEYFSPLPIS